MKNNKIPLKILICDKDINAAKTLKKTLEENNSVIKTNIVENIEDAHNILRKNDFNTIFIDPLSLGIEDSSKFIFGIRKSLPEIVFVLYIDKLASEEQRSDFYKGERKRFSHYYVFDKQTTIVQFTEELKAVIKGCQKDLSWRMSQENIDRLQHEANQLVESNTEKIQLSFLKEIRDLLSEVSPTIQNNRDKTSVFLSYRFAEQEYIDGLSELLNSSGFDVVTGISANTFISKAIINRIKNCEYFLCLMTRHHEKVDGTYTTSPWLLEEKGAALALDKNIVLMIEEGVTDIGGLQGDWQRIHFGAKGFLNAALEAVAQLKSYLG